MTRSALAIKTNDDEEIAAYSAYQTTAVFRSSPRSAEGDTPSASNEINPYIFQKSPLRAIPKVTGLEFARTFQLLQQWTGQVKQLTADSFVAIISNVTDPDAPDEEVEFGLEEVAIDDTRLVRPGSLFYWSVGYEDGIGVPRQRVSRIRFQRLPGITTRDVARAKETANKLNALFT